MRPFVNGVNIFRHTSKGVKEELSASGAYPVQGIGRGERELPRFVEVVFRKTSQNVVAAELNAVPPRLLRLNRVRACVRGRKGDED
jgi:hypothetical protein